MAFAKDVLEANLTREYLDLTGIAITKEKIDVDKKKKKKSTFKCVNGIIGPKIRHQGNLNVCWAIAIASATEALKNLHLQRQRQGQGQEDKVWVASPQELIDHVRGGGGDRKRNQGLYRISAAWDYIHTTRLAQEEHYPFRESLPKNSPPPTMERTAELPQDQLLWIQGFHHFEPVDEVSLLKRLAAQPVVVSIEANVAWESWDGLGIFTGEGSIERAVDLAIWKDLKSQEPEVVEEIRGKGKAKRKAMDDALKIVKQQDAELRNRDELKPEDFPELQTKIKLEARGGGIGNLELHAVLVVGYGTSAAGTNYFIIRNSYGESFGIQGMSKVIRACDGHEGRRDSVFQSFSYPYMEEELYPQ